MTTLPHDSWYTSAAVSLYYVYTSRFELSGSEDIGKFNFFGNGQIVLTFGFTK